MCELVEKIRELVKKYHCRTDIFKELGWSYNGSSCRKFNNIIYVNNIDISHFRNKSYLTALPKGTKDCPVCGQQIEIKIGSVRNKFVCSKGCANSYFKTGPKHCRYKPKDPTKTKYVTSVTYRKLFDKSELYCRRCDYNEFLSSVQIHHIDEDRYNNKKENLIPLCANCHRALHEKLWSLNDLE